MNLTEKLKNFMANSKKYENNSRRIAKINLQQRLDKLPEAIRVSNPFGQHFLLEKTYPLSYFHGRERLKTVFDISGRTMQLIAKNSEYELLDLKKTVFIDTETTGLAGGTGTMAFLIGVGYFSKTDFKISQYFISDYDEEAAALYSLSNLLEKYEGIVSFNGKSYDIPVLSARYMLNRMGNPLEKPFHLDLLACARRIYRERLESVSLSSLESKVLSIKRDGDIPGSQIPEVYFKFLKDKNPHPLKPIFYHNRMDILSMVALISIFARSFETPFESEGCFEEDYYCLGRVFEEMGIIDKSIECYKRASKISGVRDKACKQLSLIYKRYGRWQEAEKIWKYMVQNKINKIFALVELAKYYEHKIRDYDKAYVAAQQALDEVYRKKSIIGKSFEWEISELKKRINRIKHKQNRNIKIWDEVI